MNTQESQTTANSESLKIYVADLAAYNQGHLIGEWIDLDICDSVESIQERINEVLAKGTKACNDLDCPHEEYAIHDYENAPCSLSEYESLEFLN